MKKLLTNCFIGISLLLLMTGCAKYKKVTIKSIPDQATIFINGENSGITELKDYKLDFTEVEEYTVLAKKDKYFDEEKRIRYFPTEENGINFIMRPLTKIVTIKSNPVGARIFINGEEIGVTPITEKEFSFKEKDAYTVLAKYDLYKDKELVITFNPKTETEYYLELSQLYKDVEIKSDPEGATIYLNGEEIGITPLKKRVLFSNNDKYSAILKMNGYDNSEAKVITLNDQNKDYFFKLTKSPVVTMEVISYEPQRTDKGVKIVKVVKPSLAYREVIERSPTVKSVTRVTNNEDPRLQIDSPRLSPVDDTLIYQVNVKEENGNAYSNIWKQSVGAFAKTLVTFGKSQDISPFFSPGGEYIFFSSNRTHDNFTLWRIAVKGGGGITKITSSYSEDYYPSLTGEGEMIYYASNPPDADDAQIWSILSDGRLPTQLREGMSPMVSPDGKKIVFVKIEKESKARQLWLMDADGGNETQLTQNTAYDTVDPYWSPDGNWIVYSSNEGRNSMKEHNYDIWLLSVKTNSMTQLTTNGSQDDMPTWDLAGENIYFRSNRGGTWNIWRFQPVLQMEYANQEVGEIASKYLYNQKVVEVPITNEVPVKK